MCPSKIRTKRYEQGTVLLWGLVGLLILAALGVAAGRMALVDSKIVGNVMFDNFTYQAAESTLRRSINLYNVVETAKTEATTNADKRFGPYTDDIANGSVTSHSTMSMDAIGPCPPVLEGLAMSTSMTPSPGRVACRIFTVKAGSELPGTSAYSEHVQGVVKFVPAE